MGNPTIDIIYTNKGIFKRYGGPTYYASLALAALYNNVRVLGVVSSEVAMELRKIFQEMGVKADLIEADVTTTFELDYRTKPRNVRLVKKPSRGIERVEGDIVILSPVYDELRDAEIRAKIVVADLQGYLRAKIPLPDANLVHFSYDDIQMSMKELLNFAKRWPYVVYTLGEEGSYVVMGSKLYYINSARLNVEDVTGSGDVFLAVLTLYHYIRGMDLLASVCEASKYTAGFLITKRVQRYEYDCTIQVVQE